MRHPDEDLVVTVIVALAAIVIGLLIHHNQQGITDALAGFSHGYRMKMLR
jgi:hypothetical protein